MLKLLNNALIAEMMLSISQSYTERERGLARIHTLHVAQTVVRYRVLRHEYAPL